LKKPITKKRAGGVAQGVGPELKTPHHFFYSISTIFQPSRVEKLIYKSISYFYSWSRATNQGSQRVAASIYCEGRGRKGK
jgi:hypothetical protein